MQGVPFWVQREVNGLEHLLRIVAIIIKRLWVVGPLQFVRLEGHYHMLWRSDGAALESNCWTTFSQHGGDLLTVYQWKMLHSVLQKVLNSFFFLHPEK